MWKSIICRIKGHDWKDIQSTPVNPTPYEKFLVIIEVCKRCGRLNLAEEALINYRSLVTISTVLVAHKDFYEKRPDLRYRLIVG